MLNPKIKQILKLSIPAAVNNFFDMFQLIIDMIMLGRVSPASIAAVGVSMQFIGLLYAIMSVFNVGVSAIVSRYIGAKDKENAEKTVFNVAFISFLFSIPITILSFLYPEIIFKFMNTSEEVKENGIIYLRILSITFPMLFIEAVLYSSLNAASDTKTPLKIGIFANIINTILDYILIFGKFGFEPLGVKGAAIATTTAYIISFLIYLYLFLSKKLILSLHFKLDKEIIKKSLKIGIPSGIERAITYGSFLVFVKLIAEYGTYTLAGYQIGLRIEGLAFMPGFGFTIAAMALVGQNLGAKNPEEAEKSAILTAKIAAIFMGFMGLFMIFIPEYIALIFTDDKKTIEEASLYLKIVGISQIPLAITFVLSGALRSAGATKTTLFINGFSLWVLRIIPAYILSKIFGNILYIYLAMTFETYIKALILYYIFKKGDWKWIKI
ncbi:MATE family efflux transporter [Venenivibrio stagnispumantis]|uniref:Multidrug-efflux transporter n=1 Tax=Venenivibrio stagnispumantis TaxID=407998 RepID=A0AA45WPI1_9AQUI|nr:MATE family efflux transporter [Venenivibrio stagnispumantis]MCW4573797.1 MATE family efflux transporter [Venenivibrio stagnispumantis]SMP20277.1 putative efflux protein, MATE family [Venenivibrio stagnispumantis]